MKHYIILAGFAAMAASCNSGPKTSEATTPLPDTTGLGAYQEMKRQEQLSEGGLQEPTEAVEEKTSTSANSAKRTSSSSNTASSSNTGSSSGSGTSGSGTTAGTEKKGWSKTAKGAVIGGVAGAAGGAVINKKNRAAGAVIGGVVGAGAGAVIGNEMDKKDGRH